MLRKKKILLAEDEGRLRTGLEFILSSAGYQVTAVEDGEQAYRMIKNSDCYDVLLTDMVMPKVSGLELVKQLNRENLLPPVVVGISAFADASTLSELRDAGCSRVLDKPFQVTELLSLLSSASESNPGAGSLRQAWRNFTGTEARAEA